MEEINVLKSVYNDINYDINGVWDDTIEDANYFTDLLASTLSYFKKSEVVKEQFIEIIKHYVFKLYDELEHNKKQKENENVLKMYELVFKNEVQDYIESLNMDLEENEKALTLTEDEKDIIAHKLVFKNEYLWETIHETIDYEINYILKERGKNDE